MISQISSTECNVSAALDEMEVDAAVEKTLVDNLAVLLKSPEKGK